MKTRTFASAAAVIALYCSLPCTLPALELVHEGIPRATTVIASDAPPKNRHAAQELQHYLEKISGARLPILTDKEQNIPGNRILIGDSRFLRAYQLDIPQDFSYDEIRECYIVKTIGRDLILAGNDGGPRLQTPKRKIRPAEFFGGAYKGSLFAVYDFLNRLGCRWYFPGEFGEVVPSMKTVKADLDVKEKPFFLFRGYWQKPHTPEAMHDMDLFYHRNRFISYDAGYGGATDGSMLRHIPGKKYFKSHPEYFGLNPDKKTRNPSVLCMSHPEVRNLLYQSALKYFRDHPAATYFGIAPADGVPACWCDRCVSENGHLLRQSPHSGRLVPVISGTYYKLMMELAERIEKIYPDKLITMSIYAGRVQVPPSEFRLRKNMGGCLALLEYSPMRPIDDPLDWESAQIRSIFESWVGRMDKLSFRPYHPGFTVHFNMPIPLLRNVGKDARYFSRFRGKFCGVKWEGWPAWNTSYLTYYLWGRLLWNPDDDTEKLITRFYREFYGPAADYVKRYYDALEKAIVEFPINTHEEELLRFAYTPELVRNLSPLVIQAENAVRTSKQAFQKRVRMFRLTADHVACYAEMRGSAEPHYEFLKAAELCERMIKLEEEMIQLCPSFIFPTHYRYDRKVRKKFGFTRTGVGQERVYREILALVNGREGKLVHRLDGPWKFTADPREDGLLAQYFYSNADISKWQDIKVGKPLELQGYAVDSAKHVPFLGFCWYALDFDLAAENTRKPLALFIGGMHNEAWGWFNGRLILHQASRPWHARSLYSYTVDLPEGLAKSGKNRLTFLLSCNDRWGFGGIFRNLFMYAKTEKKAPNPENRK